MAIVGRSHKNRGGEQWPLVETEVQLLKLKYASTADRSAFELTTLLNL